MPKSEKTKKKRGRITLIEVVIILALFAIVGNFVYQIWHWRDAWEGVKELGPLGVIAALGVLFLVRKWTDSW